jgi:CRISPR-associated endonuclease Csy4
MDSYLNITVLPDEEMNENELLNKAYSKLHKALFDLQANNIGVSFPEFKCKPGRVLRIHSNATRLQQLQQLNWLGGLLGYCKVSDIQKVPSKVEYRVISRIQPTMTMSKLNRLIKRGSLTQDKVASYKTKMLSKRLENPFIELISNSGGQLYSRYIEVGHPKNDPVEGEFDYFGLSKTATIPWF